MTVALTVSFNIYNNNKPTRKPTVCMREFYNTLTRSVCQFQQIYCQQMKLAEITASPSHISVTVTITKTKIFRPSLTETNTILIFRTKII